MELIYSVILGIVFAVPYGMANWAGWQSLKQGSLLPYGAFTGRYGLTLNVFLKTVCIIVLIIVSFLLHWWVLLTFFIMWLLSGKIATWVERHLYCSEDLIDRLEYHAKKLVKDYGEDVAIQKWHEIFPRWWINRMAWKWEDKYKNRIGKILYSIDPTDPLFSKEKFDDKIK